ncbi:hypothetical protein [Flavobacterium sp.]|uniref:hypothetical protein n=1 Tax=Flavobacterium sp. TaxID=239 RepID=UPI00391BB952
MKSNLVFNSLLVVSLAFVSCKKEEESTATTDETPKEIIMPRVQSIPSQTYTQQPVENTMPVQNQQMTASQTITPNQTPVATKKGMNPPHGQPGHRCDIAVGAPLNSPPGNANQPKAGSAITQQIDPSKFTTQTTQPSATPAILSPDGTPTTTTAPGMNPPHGEEGHQCGIAVGAPLPK